MGGCTETYRVPPSWVPRKVMNNISTVVGCLKSTMHHPYPAHGCPRKVMTKVSRRVPQNLQRATFTLPWSPGKVMNNVSSRVSQSSQGVTFTLPACPKIRHGYNVSVSNPVPNILYIGYPRKRVHYAWVSKDSKINISRRKGGGGGSLSGWMRNPLRKVVYHGFRMTAECL
jgi:hypothetical protein